MRSVTGGELHLLSTLPLYSQALAQLQKGQNESAMENLLDSKAFDFLPINMAGLATSYRGGNRLSNRNKIETVACHPRPAKIDRLWR